MNTASVMVAKNYIVESNTVGITGYLKIAPCAEWPVGCWTNLPEWAIAGTWLDCDAIRQMVDASGVRATVVRIPAYVNNVRHY